MMTEVPSLLEPWGMHESLEDRLRAAPLADIMMALVFPDVYGDDPLNIGPAHSMNLASWSIVRKVVTEKRIEAVRYIQGVYGMLAEHLLRSADDGEGLIEENVRPVQTEWEKVRFLLQRTYLTPDFIQEQWPQREFAPLRRAIGLIQDDKDPVPALMLREYLHHKEIELRAHVYRDISSPEHLNAFLFPVNTPCAGQSRYKRTIAGKCARNLAEYREMHGGLVLDSEIADAWIAARPHDLGGITIFYGGAGDDKGPVEVGFSQIGEFCERHDVSLTNVVDGYASVNRISRIKGTLNPALMLSDRAGVRALNSCSIEVCVVNFAKGIEHEVGFGANRRKYDELKMRCFRLPNGAWREFSASDVVNNLYFTHCFSVSADKR